MDALSEASGTFAIRILKTLCQEDPSRNIFYSPMSISSALAMVLLGAKGSTAAQIAQVLSSSKTKDIHRDFQLLLTEVNKPGTQYSLRSVNRLFGEKSYEFLPTFKESCLKFYGAEMEQLCFEKAAEKSRKHINAWVSKQTEGKIQELLSTGSIDDQTKIVLVNAMYFKASWENQFFRKCTREMAFKVNQNEERPVQMMSQEASVNLAYVSKVQAQVLELPYAGQELSMLIVLPDDGVELSTVENTLTFEKLRAWTKPRFLKNVDAFVFLPRFKLEEDYDMQSVLQRLGVVDAFQQGLADFSGLSASTDLCVSRFVHKSFVEVNEEGTEAAAATADMFGPGCATESPPMFCADHPFLFFIRHNKTNTLLFCGRFCSP